MRSRGAPAAWMVGEHWWPPPQVGHPWEANVRWQVVTCRGCRHERASLVATRLIEQGSESAPRPVTPGRSISPTRRPSISQWRVAPKGGQPVRALCCDAGGTWGGGNESRRPPSASVVKRRPPARRLGGSPRPPTFSWPTAGRRGGYTSAVIAPCSWGSVPNRGRCASSWRSASPSVHLPASPAPGGRAPGPSSPGSTSAPRIPSLSARVAGLFREATRFPTRERRAPVSWFAHGSVAPAAQPQLAPRVSRGRGGR